MSKTFIEELQWRGMVHDFMPGLEDHLKESMRSAYVGFDPTADSLHIGNLVSIMMLRHFQIAGHRPIALVGGATGMIGDPSGKSKERNLLDEPTLRHNQEAIKNQLAKFLDFDPSLDNSAELVNNYDWMKDFSFLAFIRDVGKHITVNYMMAKEFLLKRAMVCLSLNSPTNSFRVMTFYTCIVTKKLVFKWAEATSGEILPRVQSLFEEWLAVKVLHLLAH